MLGAIAGEMSDLDHLLIFASFLIPAYYLGMPLLTRINQRLAAHPKFKALDLYKLEPSHSEFLTARTDELFELGFAEPTLVRTAGAPNVTTYLIMLVNRQTGDKAMATVMLGELVPRIQALYVEFSTRFETGEVFDTHNIKDPLAFSPGPTQVRTQVPTLHDVRILYQLHTFVMNKHGVRGKKVLYEPGQALEYLAHFFFTLPYEEKVKRGLLYYDEGWDCYRPTFKGAYLITWGLLQPFKAFRKIALRWRAGRILKEFGEAAV